MSYNPDRINIHELTVEEPEKQTELPFDPERDLSNQDWEKMLTKLRSRIQNDRNARETGEDRQFFYTRCVGLSLLAMNLKILNPRVELDLDENVWKEMRETLEAVKYNGDWQSFSEQAISIKILNPDIFALDEVGRQCMKSELERHRRARTWEAFFIQAVQVRIIDRDIDLKLDDGAWQRIRDQLEVNRKNEEWGEFALHAANMKILDPYIDLGLDEVAWHGIQTKLDEYRKADSFFEKHAVAMKILAAEEVKVTEKGLEINMRRPKAEIDSGVSSVPETKQF